MFKVATDSCSSIIPQTPRFRFRKPCSGGLFIYVTYKGCQAMDSVNTRLQVSVNYLREQIHKQFKYRSLPLSAVPFSTVSVLLGQSLSENMKMENSISLHLTVQALCHLTPS